jgi:hypothetical protein
MGGHIGCSYQIVYNPAFFYRKLIAVERADAFQGDG